jgi:hypothetical protein
MGWGYEPFRRDESRIKSLGWGLTPGQCNMYGCICTPPPTDYVTGDKSGITIGKKNVLRFISLIISHSFASKILRIYIITQFFYFFYILGCKNWVWILTVLLNAKMLLHQIFEYVFLLFHSQY